MVFISISRLSHVCKIDIMPSVVILSHVLKSKVLAASMPSIVLKEIVVPLLSRCTSQYTSLTSLAKILTSSVVLSFKNCLF